MKLHSQTVLSVAKNNKACQECALSWWFVTGVSVYVGRNMAHTRHALIWCLLSAKVYYSVTVKFIDDRRALSLHSLIDTVRLLSMTLDLEQCESFFLSLF